MCYSESWDQGCGCFEQLNIMDDMNNLGSHELRLLDVMYSLSLWIIWMILHHELRVVDDMNDYGSWAHKSKYYEQLKVMIDKNESGFWA